MGPRRKYRPQNTDRKTLHQRHPSRTKDTPNVHSHSHKMRSIRPSKSPSRRGPATLVVRDWSSVVFLNLRQSKPPGAKGRSPTKVTQALGARLPPNMSLARKASGLGSVMRCRVLVTPCALSLSCIANEAAHIERALGADCSVRYGLSADELNEALRGCREWIFCGHSNAKFQGDNTLAFDSQGDISVLPVDTIVGIVKQHRDTLRCVLINGCNSLFLAHRLVEVGVPCVICWETMVRDDAAAFFGEAFAIALARGDDHRAAFDSACSAVKSVQQLGNLDNGKRAHVPKFEFADPESLEFASARTYGRSDQSGGWAAGIPRLIPESFDPSERPMAEEFIAGLERLTLFASCVSFGTSGLAQLGIVPLSAPFLTFFSLLSLLVWIFLVWPKPGDTLGLQKKEALVQKFRKVTALYGVGSAGLLGLSSVYAAPVSSVIRWTLFTCIAAQGYRQMRRLGGSDFDLPSWFNVVTDRSKFKNAPGLHQLVGLAYTFSGVVALVYREHWTIVVPYACVGVGLLCLGFRHDGSGWCRT